MLRRLVKNIYFTVRLTVRGGGGSAPSALTVSKFENFDPFVQWNMTLGYSKHILSHCEGSQKCTDKAVDIWVCNLGQPANFNVDRENHDLFPPLFTEDPTTFL